MKRVVYTSPYVPGPWIAAHGLMACRMTVKGGPDTDGDGPMEGVCTYVRSFIREAVSDKTIDALVLTTTCDQSRRAGDWIRSVGGPPVFLMTVPRLEPTANTLPLYQNEVARLGRFLEGLGGRRPSEEALTQTLQTDDECDNRIVFTPKQDKVPLALVGGPLTTRDRELFDQVEACGGQIVLDATETGLLGQCHGHRGDAHDPRDLLVQRYFVQRWDVGRRVTDALHHRLAVPLRAAGVRGVLFRWNLWCDLWHGELACFKQHIGLPVLGIEATGNITTDRSRMGTRLGAFIEMLT